MKTQIIHGDCLIQMEKLIQQGIKVDAIITDPPYNIKNTKAGGKTNLAQSIQKANNDIYNSNLTKGYNYIKIIEEMLKLQDKINLYIWCNKAQLPLYLNYFVTIKKYSFDLIKWVKTNAMPIFHNKYLSDTEYCLYIRNGGYCMPKNYIDGSTLYQAPINSKDKIKYNHPTIKPLEIIERIVRNSTTENQTILDPFMGSGTTGVACAKLNRNFIGIEIDKEYFKIAEKRINKETNQLKLW